MGNEAKVCVIIPMRKGSRRVVNKNIKDFNGRPLFTVLLDTLQKVAEVSSILIDTNDERIKTILADDYPNIMVIDRPEELSSEFESVNNIIHYDLQFIEEDLVMQTHVTNPLVKPGTFSKAIRTLYDALEEKDALFSVTRQFERFWDKDGEPVNHDPAKLIRTQDLPPFYVENSCIYLFTKEGFVSAGKNRLGTKRIMFEIPELEAIDIDYPIDFEFAAMVEREQDE